MRHPVICVDVQPAYDSYEREGRSTTPIMVQIMEFVQKQTGPILMFVNAEETGNTDDDIHDIQQYWNDTLCSYTDEEDRFTYNDETNEYEEAECDTEMNWGNVTIVDKGYGYMRAWMDSGVPENLIIKTIREMYQQKVSDSRMLFGGEDTEDYVAQMNEFLGTDEYESLYDDNMSVEWTSVARLKQFSGAYIVGGGRTECLREVELLMNAFNIKYKRINSLVYG